MRQITKEATRAFLNDMNYCKSNTQVKTDCTGTYMYLFNNMIARKVGNRIQITLAGWNSNTTRERLNALPNVRLTQKNFTPYLNGQEIDVDEWYQITP